MTTALAPWWLTAYRDVRFFVRRRLCDLLAGHRLGAGFREYMRATGEAFEVYQCQRCMALFFKKCGEE